MFTSGISIGSRSFAGSAHTLVSAEEALRAVRILAAFSVLLPDVLAATSLIGVRVAEAFTLLDGNETAVTRLSSREALANFIDASAVEALKRWGTFFTNERAVCAQPVVAHESVRTMELELAFLVWPRHFPAMLEAT